MTENTSKSTDSMSASHGPVEAVQDYARRLLGLEPSAYCGQCHERGTDVMMREDVVFDYGIFEDVDAWVCPECGHAVVREDEF